MHIALNKNDNECASFEMSDFFIICLSMLNPQLETRNSCILQIFILVLNCVPANACVIAIHITTYVTAKLNNVIAIYCCSVSQLGKKPERILS